MLQLDRTRPGPRRLVIMGCDGPGVIVAESLSEKGHTVYILDLQASSFDRLPADRIEDGQIVPIVGDGTIKEDLVRASINDADVFMALSNNETRNVLAGQMAKHIYKVPTAICRIDDPTLQDMYNKLGIVAVSATTLVTQMVVESVGL